MNKVQVTKGITNRESDSVQRYFNDLARVGKNLLDEPEDELIRRIRQGDQKAFETLITANLGFVVSVAKQYQNMGAPLLDLINAGNVGIINAAKRFDASKGFKFISYAIWFIKQELSIIVSEYQRPIRLPLNRISDMSKVKNAFRLFTAQHPDDPTPAELAAILDCSEEEVDEALHDLRFRCKSFDEPIRHDNGDESHGLHEIAKDEWARDPDYELSYLASLQHDVRQVVSFLKPNQQTVMNLLFGIGVEYPMTLKDISEELGITTTRVSQIRDKSFEVIKKSPGAMNLLMNHIAA